MDLRDLLAVLPERRLLGSPPQRVVSLVTDSRRAAPGALFVALRGERTDGHAHAAAAVERGVAAVVVERELDLPAGTAQIVVPDSRRAISLLADRFFDHPSRALRVAGITGTNGKTTTAYLLAAALGGAGESCGIIGTLGARLGNRTWPLANTTPLALELQETIATLRDAGASSVAMEVSSHALALGRVADVSFAVAALTNVTRDHLDFHRDLESYVAAKRSLFDLAPHAVLNADDGTGAALARERRAAGLATTTYALRADADLRPERLQVRADGSSFVIDGVPVELRLPGRFNVQNALAALGVARVLDVDLAAAARGAGTLGAVPGRMERLAADGVTVFVDYAHTPDALENVLRTARETTAGQLIVVFGAGGDRDPGKRPLMGAVARRLADRTIVTSDNPRSEDPASIARAVAAGGDHEIVLDRRAAIAAAVGAAVSGDVVVIAGKGHEPYQIVRNETLAFDDRDEARAALAARRNVRA